MLAVILGAVILALAAVILGRRAYQFYKTRGRSACSNCPYSGNCSGGCGR